jgi:protein gp37
MSGTAIQWTDATWNPVTGCSKVSAGCDNCYAQQLHNRRYRATVSAALERVERHHGETVAQLIARARGQERAEGDSILPFRSRTYDEPFAVVRCHPERVVAMLGSRRWAGRRVFVNSMSDLFHERVPDEFLRLVFWAMAGRPEITFQVLTKRPRRMAEFVTGFLDRDWPMGPLPNVWLGTSVEDQQSADERMGALVDVPAVVRFLSIEPLLEEVELMPLFVSYDRATRGWEGTDAVHWVIVGGESGPKARPCDPGWIRLVRDQCRAAGVAVFVKQLGRRPCIGQVESAAGSGVFEPDLVKLRHPQGGNPAEWPEDLRVREFPVVRSSSELLRAWEAGR